MCLCFEGSGETELTDIVCSMYPSVDRTIALSIKHTDRPVILCEYSHVMGNSNGNIHLYWETFWDESMPRLQGGFIWDMLDQGLRKIEPLSGKEFFAYGGDFGDKVNHKQFCINVSNLIKQMIRNFDGYHISTALSKPWRIIYQGISPPDQEPHPAVLEIKYLQQPILFTLSYDGRTIITDGCESIEIQIKNRYSFRSLSEVRFKWYITSETTSKAILSSELIEI